MNVNNPAFSLGIKLWIQKACRNRQNDYSVEWIFFFSKVSSRTHFEYFIKFKLYWVDPKYMAEGDSIIYNMFILLNMLCTPIYSSEEPIKSKVSFKKIRVETQNTINVSSVITNNLIPKKKADICFLFKCKVVHFQHFILGVHQWRSQFKVTRMVGWWWWGSFALNTFEVFQNRERKM